MSRQLGATSLQLVAMPHELSILPSPPMTGSAESKPVTHVPTAKPEHAPPQPFTNPDLRLDPALGLVVIEFHDQAGKLTSSIPSQRQMDAYRMHEEKPPIGGTSGGGQNGGGGHGKTAVG